MPVKLTDLKKSAIDDAWGNTTTMQPPKKKVESKSVSKPASAIDDAWNAVDKKKSGTEDGGTISPTNAPTQSNADLASQLAERMDKAIESGQAKPVDESGYDNTIFGSRKIKPKNNGFMGALDDLKSVLRWGADMQFKSKLSDGDLTPEDIETYKTNNPEKYNRLVRDNFPTMGDSFLKSSTTAKLLSEKLNTSVKEKNFIQAKNYDANYYKNIDNIIIEKAAPLNKYLSSTGIPLQIKPTNSVDDSRSQLAALTEADRKNNQQINKDKIVTYYTPSGGASAIGGYTNNSGNTRTFDVSKMTDEAIESEKGTPDLYNQLKAAKEKVRKGNELSSMLHDVINPVQSKFGSNLITKIKSNPLPDPNKTGNDDVREIGEQIFKLKDPETYAIYQKAGGYNHNNTYADQVFNSDLDQVNKEIMTLGYSSLRGETAANGTPGQYANIYDNLKYLDYKFSTPLEQETKHKIAASLKRNGVSPTSASDEQKDNAARNLPKENQDVWFNKTKESGHTDLPNTGFWYSAANSAQNTLTNAAKSGSILSPTAWATLFLGTSDDKEIAQEILRDRMQSNVLGENPESKQRYDALKEKQQEKNITPQELNELNDLSSFIDVRTSWDKFKDGNGNMAGMIAGVTVDNLPFLMGGVISKTAIAGTESLIAKDAAVKGLSEVPLIEQTTIDATKTLAEKWSLPRDTKSIINFAKNKNEMFVIMHHDNAKRAMELFPEDDTKKAWYTGITDVLSMAMPNLLPTHKLGKLFDIETKDIVSDLVGKLTNGNLDNAVVDNMMKETAKKIIGKAGTFLVGTEKTAAEASLTMSLMNLGNNVTQAILKPDSINGGDIANNFLQTFSSTFMDSQLIGLVGGHGAMQKKYGQVGVDAIYNATRDENSINSVKFAIEKQKSKGELTQDQVNEKIQLLNTAAELRPSVNRLQVEENLNEKEAKRVFINLLNERIIKNQIKKLKETGDSETLIAPKEERIKEINDINAKIIGKEIYVNDDYSIIDKKTKDEQDIAAKQTDTKLSEPIEGLDEQGIPKGENVPPPVEEENIDQQDEKLTEDQSVEWDNLSMQEKLKLAKENLPEVDKLSDADTAKIADKNAKILLDKLHGVEAKDIPSSKTTPDGESNKKEGDKEADAQKGKESNGEKNANVINEGAAEPENEKAAPLLERAKEIANSDIIEGYSGEPLKEAANNNPEQFNKYLQNIAEQAQDPASKETTVKTYGQELVDIANQLHPAKEPPPPTEKAGEAEITDSEDQFTHINKKDITDAEDLASKYPFGESESWKNSVKKGLEKLAKIAKEDESLYDVAKTKVSDWAAKIKQDIIDDGKSTFNPSDEEIAQMAYHRTMTNKRIAELEPDLTSPIQAVRDASEVVLSDLEAQRDMVDYVLHNTATTAGRAFNIRQMISKIDNENGLQVKRMDIIRKQKGEPLSEKQEQEIRNIHDKEMRNQKEKDEYSKKKAEKDFEEAVKLEVERRMKEKGNPSNKAFARTRAGNAIRKLKMPKGGGLKTDFTLGSWDLLVEGVAKLVDTGINITEAVHQLIKEGVIAFKTDKDRDAAIDYMDNAAKYNAIDGIRELAEKEKSEMLTKSAVGKNYINDLVSHYIDKGLRGKEVFSELNKDLKEIFPDITEQQVRDAYLKEGEFVLDKKENINKAKTDARHELRSIAKNETDIADLKEERDLRKREREEREKTDYENKLIAEKKGLVDKKALTERQEQRLGELNKELDRIKQRKEKDAKVSNPKDLNRSDKEKEVLDEIKKEKEDWVKEKKAQRELEGAAKKAQTAATNEAARLKALTEKRDRIEKGQRDAAKPSTPKVENPAIEQVKAEIKDVDKRLRDAESEANRLNKELQDKKDKLSEVEANIKRAENGLESIKTNRKKSDAKIDADISEAEKRLQKELNKQGLKLEKGSKAEKEQKQKVADSHNERVDKLIEGVDTKLQDDTLSDSEKSALENAKKILEKSKINPDSKLDIFDAVDKAEKNTELARSELASSEKLADIKKEITQSQIQMGKDKLQTEQDILLQRHKDNLQKKIDENERRLESGEYVEKEPARLKTSDAEAVKLEIKDRDTKNKLNAIGKAAQRAAMTKREKFIDTVQSLYVIGLVGRASTLAKVAVSALTKQPLNTITSQTFGRLGGKVFPKIKNALRGEGNEGWRKEKNRYMAHYGALGKEGMAKLVNKGKVNEQKADEAYRNAKDKLENIGNTHGKDSKQYKDFEKGEFKTAEDKQKQALLDNVTNSLYEWIGGNSWADAAEVFLHSSAKLEQLLGKGEREMWKDKTRKEKIMFVLSTSAATHGVLKNFSARAEFAASFVARLENKMKQGIDISSAEEILKTVNESYIAFQRGKYQEDNAITGGFKAGLEGLQKWAEKHPDYKYAADIMAGALKFKNPVVRTPLNIAREAIVEYTIGVPLAIAKYRKSLHDAKVDANSFDLSGLEMKDHMRKFMDNIPADKADFIYRAFRKGGFGLGVMALTAMGGIKFGGFFNRDEKRRKGGDDLGVNEVEIGGHKLSPLQAKIFEHTSAFFPALLWSNYDRVRDENLEAGNGEVSANLDAVVKDFQGIWDMIPIGKEVQNPLQGIQLPLIGPFLSEYAEASDVDANGDRIKRKPQGNPIEKLWQNFELKIPGLRQNVEEQ